MHYFVYNFKATAAEGGAYFKFGSFQKKKTFWTNKYPNIIFSHINTP